MSVNTIEQRLNQSPGLRDFFAEIERDRQRLELRKINADPEKHRDTMLMGDSGLRYRFFEIKTGRVSRARFAYSMTPNAAGYYLTWRETIKSDRTGKREYIRGHKLRREAKDSALKGYENFKALRHNRAAGGRR